MIDLFAKLGIGFKAKGVVALDTHLEIVEPHVLSPYPEHLNKLLIIGESVSGPVKKSSHFIVLYSGSYDIKRAYDFFKRMGNSPIDLDRFKDVVSRWGETFDTYEEFRLATKYSLKRAFGNW